MSHIVQCPSCDSQYRAEDDQLGTQLQCSTCNSTFTAEVPVAAGPTEGPPAVPDGPASMAYARPGSGKAIAALVLGIVSIPTCFSYGIISMICGILGVVFGTSAKRAIQRGEMPQSAEGMAKAGRICGWVGIGLSLLVWGLAIVFILVAVSSSRSGYMYP